MTKSPKWFRPLSATPLLGQNSGTTTTDDYMVNSVALSGDGSLIVAGTYYYPFDGTQRKKTDGTFGVYFYNSGGQRLWADEFDGDEGVYSVAMSDDGKTAAAGGLHHGGTYGRPGPTLAFLRAYDVAKKTTLLDYTDPHFNTIVNSVSMSSKGDVIAAATKTSLYVFSQSHGAFPAVPAIPFGVTKSIDSVAVSPDGSWFAACGKNGDVYEGTIEPGAVKNPATWTEPAHTHFVCTTVAQSASLFVVAGGSVVYLFRKGSAASGFIAKYKLPASSGKNIRFVAISDDGELITAVANRGDDAGLLFALAVSGNTLTPAWDFQIAQKPNSTTMDKAAIYFTLAEGYPDDVPGCFSLFKKTGKLWEFKTPKMNWPMVISANGKAIAGGGDDNMLYFFEP